jgi:alanyl-tRNA synthetase
VRRGICSNGQFAPPATGIDNPTNEKTKEKTMKASELRARYLAFFSARDHRKLPSSPLVPSDPTLLFTSAGMVQFKDYFAGRAAAPYPRVTTCQKCFRTTDIENVGKTAFHQTFFEMLGNFSFGDYFKQGAIELAWEFLTRELGMSQDRLWVTIYQDDDEAHDIWRDVIGVPTDRIVRLGKKHNWWGPVGDSGPCGPDSEIHYDTGVENGCGDPECAGPACDCNRFSEIWNLVFMQYEAKEDGTLVPLTQRNIDTGMGLERTTTTLQGAESNFETDLFRPMVEAIEAAAPRRMTPEDIVFRNTIADHVRAVLFLMSEGVMPSNERQGYVLRRILRRAVRAGERLELSPGSLATFVEPVIDAMGTTYPEIARVRDVAQRLIGREETTFRRTLREGERRLAKVLKELSGSGERRIPGTVAFELNDTYGFPLEMTQEIAAEHGMHVDMAEFGDEMEKQRTRARAAMEASSSMDADATVTRSWHRRGDSDPQFVGYDHDVFTTTVTGFDQDEKRVAFRETPFYAQGGGQVADVGTIRNLTKGFEVRVVSATKHEAGAILHHIEGASAAFDPGDECALQVDVERRNCIRRNHTATHLLHAGLRSVLGAHVAQAGSLVNDRELRFDFSHFEKLTEEQIAAVEDFANAAVLADHPVTTELLPIEQATASGAIGLFEDEYRGKPAVRVVSVNAVSKELCGGTHVSRSGEIGLIKIVSEESIAAGTRRLRAITGDGVLAYLRQQDDFQRVMRAQLGDDPLAGVEHLRAQIDALTAQMETVAAGRVHAMSQDMAGKAILVGGAHLIVHRADLPVDQLKSLADRIEELTQPAVIVLAGEHAGRALVVCKVSKSIRAVRAGDVVKTMSQTLGGGGGGAPTFAQGGGQDTAKIDSALERAGGDIRRALAA